MTLAWGSCFRLWTCELLFVSRLISSSCLALFFKTTFLSPDEAQWLNGPLYPESIISVVCYSFASLNIICPESWCFKCSAHLVCLEHHSVFFSESLWRPLTTHHLVDLGVRKEVKPTVNKVSKVRPGQNPGSANSLALWFGDKLLMSPRFRFLICKVEKAEFPSPWATVRLCVILEKNTSVASSPE